MRISDWSSDVCSSDLHLDDIEAVIKILAKCAAADQLAHMLVRGRDHAHVDGDLAFGADRAHCALLQREQQLDLHVRRQIGDFVEKQRAVLGGLEQTGLVAVRTGEAALQMAEEFALHQLRRNRAAIDRHERSTCTRRSEEHTSELQSLMRISYAVFCLKKKKHKHNKQTTH